MKNPWDSVYENSEIAGNAWKGDPDLFVLDRFLPRLHKDSQILDLGCGDGRNILYLLKLGYKVIGVDISQKAIEVTRNLAEHYNVAEGLSLINCNAENIPLDNNVIDVVYSTQVLDHIDKPQLISSEVWRILKKEGQFIGQLSSTDDPAIKLGTFLSNKKRQFNGFLFQFYDSQDLKEIFSEFELRTIDKIQTQDPPHTGWREEEHIHDYWIVEAVKK